MKLDGVVAFKPPTASRVSAAVVGRPHEAVADRQHRQPADDRQHSANAAAARRRTWARGRVIIGGRHVEAGSLALAWLDAHARGLRLERSIVERLASLD